MTVIIISIVAAWILLSALLVTILCMNSSRISREEPFKDPFDIQLAAIKKMMEEHEENLDQD